MARKTNNEMLINNPDILFKYSVDMLVITVSLLLAGFYINGFNAIRLALWSVLTSVLCEDIACRIMKRTDRKANNLYAAATGLAIALMLPATAPAYIAVSGCLFAVLAVMVPFGSARRIPFVPAAAGICFVTVCFPQEVFLYSAVNIGVSSPLSGADGFIPGESFGKMLTYGESVILNPLETVSVLVGKTAGPMGTTCMLALIGCAFYLLFKRKENFVISIAFFAACAAFSALFPRVNSGAYTSIVMELSAGTLVFVGLLLLPDSFTSPNTLSGKIFYGIFSGILCMLFRRYGAYEECVCFAVLIMNAAAPATGYYIEILKENLIEKGVIKKKTPKFSEANITEMKQKRVRAKEVSPQTALKLKAKEEKREEKKIKREENKLKKEQVRDGKDAAKNEKKEAATKKRAEKSRIKRESEKATNSSDGKTESQKRFNIDAFSYDELMNFDDDVSDEKKEGEDNG